ncbi:galactokinase [Klugiella xanthotipulae]|uniref:Galactokinase n=1 Tax=Klugiella xanthotipulae TaxID=244735 RepID=A0A543I529_9MICO|nr:galactokinase [Klugiella xanthotipulae]TQM65669.1 galactokinase [Klugiella xanthotipulae]
MNTSTPPGDDRTATADSTARTFEQLTGRAPDGVWSAPGRVNLIGEHTDYNLGFVFPCAINLRTWAAVGLRSDGIVRVTTGLSGTDGTGNSPEGPATIPAAEVPRAQLTAATASGWSAYPLGVLWALSERGADLTTLPGVDIHLESTVPVGAGLSSSAAIECATAVAINELWGLGLSRPELAAVGQRAENVAVGAPTGIMDQSASLLGVADHGVFLDCRSLDATLIPLGLAAAGLELLVIDTTVSHSHATGGYASRRAACEQACLTLGVPSLRDLGPDDLPRAEAALDQETFRRVRHVITENQRVLDTVQTVRERGAAAIGPLLDASHRSMRDDYEISVPELDLAVEASRAAGALGARMTGGGFGGAAIALVPGTRTGQVTREVRAAFRAAGFATPTIFPVTASAGAARDR